MLPVSDVAFKEWAVVVDALGRGEQILILRKGGIHEERGLFKVEHQEFWLYPTNYHEAEQSVIPAKRPSLRLLAARETQATVEIQYYAVADLVLRIDDFGVLSRLQGLHIWNEQILRERFQFGRAPGLQVLAVRVFHRLSPVRLPICASYGGCKSWITLEQGVPTESLTPVLPDAEYNRQREQIRERLSDHALVDS
jgi:hypothetical protein